MSTRQKEKTNISPNPLKYMLYLSIFGLILSFFGILMALNAFNMLDGANYAGPRGISPLMLLHIPSAFLFIYLYSRRSKYAWHVIAVTAILNDAIYYTFKAAGIYFIVERSFSHYAMHIAATIIFWVYLLHIRKRYFAFVSHPEPM